MTRRDPIVAAVFAVAVTLAGTACACAIPGTDAGSADSHHHAHHGGHGHVGASECVHADCQGDCGVNAAVPERDSGAKPPKTSPDIGIAAVALPAPVLSARPLSCHSPPFRSWHEADTPVRRFDVLLN
ncbi:MAG: hypothetical protein F4X98_14845 [Gammaproteobacteria bacterium]|nr:hypothetical protein [Gammaproteobacteria bacterium]